MSSRVAARCSREAQNCCWTKRRWWTGICRPCAASCRRRLPRRAGPLSGPWKADTRTRRSGYKMPSTGLRGSQDAFKENRLGLTLYVRFEQVLAVVGVALVAVILVVAVV